MDPISPAREATAATATRSAATSRRSLLRTAAWASPAVLVATSAPAFARSTSNLGALELNGTCGVLGVLGPGFTLTAGPDAPIPEGTIVTITGSGIVNIGVFSITGGTASVNVLSPASRTITLTAPLPAGATLSMRTTLSISVAFTLNAAVTLPATYTATGSKLSGSVASTLILCSAT